LKRTYIDALLDLHHLIDEYRFEALLALAILRDYVIKRDRGEAPVVTLGPETTLTDTLPIPAETVLVMRRYAVEPPNAAELFENPHQQIAGGRMLSRWFGAQLIDSALYRGVAACDRLAILLRCQAGLPVVVTKAGERRQPAFTPGWMKDLVAHYEAVADWPALRDLSANPFFEFIRQERNGFTHERRRPSELHGETAIVLGAVDDGPQQTVPAMDPQSHYALAAAFYNEILIPALSLSRSVITTTAKGSGETS
jgi:hypothetical protein